MLSHLLDTSVYSQPLRPTPLPSVQRRWAALGDERLATSVICEAEVLYGIELRQSSRLREAYAAILRGRVELLPVDAGVAAAFAQLKAGARRRGRSVSDFDLLIGATAKVHGLIVATLNARHFASIEGVAVEDWSA